MLSRFIALAAITLLVGGCSSLALDVPVPSTPPPGPDEAVLEWLAAGSFYIPDVGQAPAADLATVRYLKVRETDNHRCLAIEWHDETGVYWSGILGVSQRPDARWDVDGGGWGEGPTPDLAINEPRAYLAGSWNDHFCLGSWVYDPTGIVTLARLVSADTVLAEDTVDDGVVVFLGEVPLGPNPMVELYDSEGHLVARHEP